MRPFHVGVEKLVKAEIFIFLAGLLGSKLQILCNTAPKNINKKYSGSKVSYFALNARAKVQVTSCPPMQQMCSQTRIHA